MKRVVEVRDSIFFVLDTETGDLQEHVLVSGVADMDYLGIEGITQNSDGSVEAHVVYEPSRIAAMYSLLLGADINLIDGVLYRFKPHGIPASAVRFSDFCEKIEYSVFLMGLSGVYFLDDKVKLSNRMNWYSSQVSSNLVMDISGCSDLNLYSNLRFFKDRITLIEDKDVHRKALLRSAFECGMDWGLLEDGIYIHPEDEDVVREYVIKHMNRKCFDFLPPYYVKKYASVGAMIKGYLNTGKMDMSWKAVAEIFKAVKSAKVPVLKSGEAFDTAIQVALAYVLLQGSSPELLKRCRKVLKAFHFQVKVGM